MAIIEAPFTGEQVQALNEWQRNRHRHPFTCGRCRDAAEFPLTKEYALVAMKSGWYCPDCDYTQDWAHDFMARPRSVNPFA